MSISWQCSVSVTDGVPVREVIDGCRLPRRAATLLRVAQDPSDLLSGPLLNKHFLFCGRSNIGAQETRSNGAFVVQSPDA